MYLKKFITSMVIGIMFGIAMWSWYLVRFDHITDTPVLEGGEILGTVNRVLDPLLYGFFIFLGRVAFGWKYLSLGEPGAKKYDYLSLLLTIPAIIAFATIFACGWTVGLYVAGAAYAVFGFFALCLYGLTWITSIGKNLGSN